MYTINEREEILNKLCSIISSIPKVEGLILVGSGAIGFADEWSDIDLSVVIYPDDDTQYIWEELNSRVLKEFAICKYQLNKYGMNNYISVIMLDNFLEIDIGVISLSNLVAKNERWKVLFDRSGKVTEAMENTWKTRKLPGIKEEVQHSLEGIWYHFKNAGFALKRNKLYRAVKELEEIRNEIVWLKAIQENKVAKHFRDVDEMDKHFIERLGKTFFNEIEVGTLTNTFIKLFDLYFDVVRTINDSPETSLFENKLRGFFSELGMLSK